MPPLDTLITQLEAAADPAQAEAMAAYMKGHFPFLGIKAPLRRSLSRAFLQTAIGPGKRVDHGLIHALWDRPEREYQYVALDLMARYQRHAPVDDLDLYEDLITTKSWWDTVDLLAAQLCGPLLRRHPAELATRPEAWISSDQLWLQRTALLYQLKYRTHTDWPRLQRYILSLAHSRAFFLTKAMGWALREYAKTDPAAVQAFVAAHDLPPLTQREALKRVGAAGS